MSGAIFLIQDDGKLMELNEQAYDSEDLLQTLLAQVSHLLAGDQIDSDVGSRESIRFLYPFVRLSRQYTFSYLSLDLWEN